MSTAEHTVKQADACETPSTRSALTAVVDEPATDQKISKDCSRDVAGSFSALTDARDVPWNRTGPPGV